MAARVELRALQPEDAAAVEAFRGANREFLGPWEPARDESFSTLEAALAAIDLQQAECEAGRSYAFGIFEPGGLVGYVNLNAVVRDGVFQNAYLGYAVAEEANGRGYATEAVCAAVRIAFEELSLHRLQAAVMPHNAGSIRVLEKAGFRREGLAEGYLLINGTWEDHVLFAVTRDEYRSPE